MIFCPKCGYIVGKHDNFCAHCGGKIINSLKTEDAIKEYCNNDIFTTEEVHNIFIKGPSKKEIYIRNKELIKRVIFNEPYTIVIWANREKTIVKAQDGEPYDKEKGLAMCFAKYALGNTCRYFDFFKEVCDEVEEKTETKESSK